MDEGGCWHKILEALAESSQFGAGGGGSGSLPGGPPGRAVSQYFLVQTFKFILLRAFRISKAQVVWLPRHPERGRSVSRQGSETVCNCKVAHNAGSRCETRMGRASCLMARTHTTPISWLRPACSIRKIHAFTMHTRLYVSTKPEQVEQATRDQSTNVFSIIIIIGVQQAIKR